MVLLKIYILAFSEINYFFNQFSICCNYSGPLNHKVIGTVTGDFTVINLIPDNLKHNEQGKAAIIILQIVKGEPGYYPIMGE